MGMFKVENIICVLDIYIYFTSDMDMRWKTYVILGCEVIVTDVSCWFQVCPAISDGTEKKTRNEVDSNIL